MNYNSSLIFISYQANWGFLLMLHLMVHIEFSAASRGLRRPHPTWKLVSGCRPFRYENFDASWSSLRRVEAEIWPKRCFWPFRRPGHWPLTFCHENFVSVRCWPEKHTLKFWGKSVQQFLCNFARLRWIFSHPEFWLILFSVSDKYSDHLIKTTMLVCPGPFSCSNKLLHGHSEGSEAWSRYWGQDGFKLKFSAKAGLVDLPKSRESLISYRWSPLRSECTFSLWAIFLEQTKILWHLLFI